ncbi:bifunctional 2-polyprenyl-6-hydroxyphenol methylase/3-demethylubiquinol 3-O-methyltransferase UbiG [Geomicrobium sp. JCM 19055]|uniref:class I SAM-dependent methyltransferase n=1 Tax=Geomicrobium sp. JCM 19055 TaxID=1460649 RepID=UPI0022363FBC|nr:class I SAM-dependent methyltransferase [Geomicrobium sp. JCM 19055]
MRSKFLFFKEEGPDENLYELYNGGFRPVQVLELGCGNGRNAIFMEKMGSKVDAVDISQNAINWAIEKN